MSSTIYQQMLLPAARQDDAEIARIATDQLCAVPGVVAVQDMGPVLLVLYDPEMISEDELSTMWLGRRGLLERGE